jgi:hypothetical protein
MRNRKKTTWFGTLLAKAIVWTAKRVLETIPIIGPIFKIMSFVSDVQKVRRVHRHRLYAATTA